MNRRFVFFLVLPLLFPAAATVQKLASNIPYVENGHKRHVLDIYTPEKPAGRSLPVMFWIHGGGWQTGDKSDVALKPKVLDWSADSSLSRQTTGFCRRWIWTS